MSGVGSRVRAVLVGPPGAGKSTIAAALAERLGVGQVDTDALVESGAGKVIAEIFVDEGEPEFRRLEREAVREALTPGESRVVALGGGSVLDADTRADLRGHAVVLLTVGIADAAGRVGLDRSRPLLGLAPRAAWVQLLKDRQHLYDEVATVRVDTTGRTPEDIVEEIVTALSLATPDEVEEQR